MKEKCSSVKLKAFLQDSGEQYFSKDGEILFCKSLHLCLKKILLCNNIVIWQSKTILSHLPARARGSVCCFKKPQQPHRETTAAFSKDLCQMVVYIIILLNKVSSWQFFFLKEIYGSAHFQWISIVKKLLVYLFWRCFNKNKMQCGR
jgi:hypothetical protein